MQMPIKSYGTTNPSRDFVQTNLQTLALSLKDLPESFNGKTSIVRVTQTTHHISSREKHRTPSLV